MKRHWGFFSSLNRNKREQKNVFRKKRKICHQPFCSMKPYWWIDVISASSSSQWTKKKSTPPTKESSLWIFVCDFLFLFMLKLFLYLFFKCTSYQYETHTPVRTLGFAKITIFFRNVHACNSNCNNNNQTISNEKHVSNRFQIYGTIH